jgi:hypothetical protein
LRAEPEPAARLVAAEGYQYDYALQTMKGIPYDVGATTIPMMPSVFVELPRRHGQERIAPREQPALRSALPPPRAQHFEQHWR